MLLYVFRSLLRSELPLPVLLLHRARNTFSMAGNNNNNNIRKRLRAAAAEVRPMDYEAETAKVLVEV